MEKYLYYQVWLSIFDVFAEFDSPYVMNNEYAKKQNKNILRLPVPLKGKLNKKLL